MLTPRGWWLLLLIALLLLLGLLGSVALLTVVGLVLLLWFSWEWFVFTSRVASVLPRLRLHRRVEDERGPVANLWAGRTFTVHLRVALPEGSRLPFLGAIDRPPFHVEWADGRLTAAGPVGDDRTLDITYRVRAPRVGVARFEGVRVQFADLQGFFFHSAFHRDPAVYRVMPPPPPVDAAPPAVKRQNLLLPPGQHRLARAGSGGELLDLRDYLPGDPPKTIAWKVSARRDKLITKEYESEVPLRCTLFVDTSGSVRVPTARGTALHRLIDLAAAVLHANTLGHDLTGLTLFGEDGVTVIRPDRNRSHGTRVLRALADAAMLAPASARVDAGHLLPLAAALLQDVYPELVRPEVNGMPWWVPWLASLPGYSRRATVFHVLNRWKSALFVAPVGLTAASTLFCLLGWAFGEGWYWLAFLTMALTALVPPLILLSPLLALPIRTRVLWRKRVSAVLAARYDLGPGGVAALIEDEDAFSLYVQHLLAEHHVPYRLPLYDRAGRYLFAAPRKIPTLAAALLRAVGKGRDNELFVLLVDVLELDDHLQPLVRAVSVALSRHHQVILLVPWPPGLPLPPADAEAGAAAPEPDGAEPKTVRGILRRSTRRCFHDAYGRVRRTFARIGVTVVCAAGDEAVPLVLQRLDRLRTARRGVRR